MGVAERALDEKHFLARGAHLEALKKEGLFIESPIGDAHLPDIHATDEPAEIGPVDFVLFAVKLWDTKAAAATLAPLIGPETRVLTLQNGIDSIDLLAGYVERERIAGGVIYLGTVIGRPGVIRNAGGIKQLICDRQGGNRLIADFVAACNRCVGLDAETTDDPQRAMWEKYVTLIAMSGSTALTRRTAGDIRANPETRAFLRMLMEETVAVANARGVPIPKEFVEDRLAHFERLPPHFKASMLEDLERGRRLELPWLGSRIHGLGRELGIPTPANSAVHYGLILHQEGG
ncbi:MAG TPA: 2-dehydropantoate 2-reductase [Afifellaceae bacterium]|nr:2-dehydropantoate 2-reductase [Afifellaceae bacterium]